MFFFANKHVIFINYKFYNLCYFCRNNYYMKTYRKIYHQLLDYVADEMELMKEDILSSKREDCVNARIVLCQCMSNHITDSEICELTGFSQQLISKNKSLFIDRHKHSQTIRLMSILVEKFINEKIEEIKSTTISQ